MADKRSHRGPHPEDGRLFAPEHWPALQGAVRDLAWLLSQGYGLHSALKLVGDRFALSERQRLAVMRSTCSAEALAGRKAREVRVEALGGKAIWVDGYNLLTTVEAALGGGVLLRGMEGCLRDMASMHGHYKRVAETGPALELIGATLGGLGVEQVEVLLDAPVSNSGRLKTMMGKLAGERGWPWTVRLVPDPDPVLAESAEIIVTADSVILDGARNHEGVGAARWVNLAGCVIGEHVAGAVVVEMAG